MARGLSFRICPDREQDRVIPVRIRGPRDREERLEWIHDVWWECTGMCPAEYDNLFVQENDGYNYRETYEEILPRLIRVHGSWDVLLDDMHDQILQFWMDHPEWDSPKTREVFGQLLPTWKMTEEKWGHQRAGNVHLTPQNDGDEHSFIQTGQECPLVRMCLRVRNWGKKMRDH